jgi:hypothetical protein
MANEGKLIPLQEAAGLTAAYRQNHPGQIQGFLFGKTNVEEILNQRGCVSVRSYLGQNPDGSLELIVVGVDANGNDMLDKVLDRSHKCPPLCGDQNVLNSNK